MQEETKKEYVDEWLQYDISEDEKKELSIELANQTIELEMMEARKKSIVAEIKKDMEKAQLDIKSNATKIKDGFEMRSIECEVVRDHVEGVVRHIRTDTGEVAKERKMTNQERQRHIDEILQSEQAEEVGA